MIRTIPPANREALEQGLRRLKLRHMREHLDDINELALQEEPSYMDFLGYLVVREVEGRGANPKGNPAQVGSVTVSPNPG